MPKRKALYPVLGFISNNIAARIKFISSKILKIEDLLSLNHSAFIKFFIDLPRNYIPLFHLMQ